NVVKHAAAKEVRVELKLDSAKLILLVGDNGLGFATNGTPQNVPSKADRIARGNGLANMKRRLEEIGGVCEISSAPGKGTTVTFTVPLHRLFSRQDKMS